MGYDLVKANALKVFIVLLYSPFALIVFMLNDHVHYDIGAMQLLEMYSEALLPHILPSIGVLTS